MLKGSRREVAIIYFIVVDFCEIDDPCDNIIIDCKSENHKRLFA